MESVEKAVRSDSNKKSKKNRMFTRKELGKIVKDVIAENNKKWEDKINANEKTLKNRELKIAKAELEIEIIKQLIEANLPIGYVSFIPATKVEEIKEYITILKAEYNSEIERRISLRLKENNALNVVIAKTYTQNKDRS